MLGGLLVPGVASFLCLAVFLLLMARFDVNRRLETPTARKHREKAEAEAKQRKLFMRAAKKETKYLMKRIPDELAIQNRVQHQLANQLDRKAKRKVVRIRLRDACIKETEVWFPLNSRDFPYGVGFHDLLNDANHMIPNLEKGIRRSCRPEVDPIYHDVYLVVSFRNSLGGLPLVVHWSDVIEALDKKNRYSVVLGINKAGRVVAQNLTKWPHGLILGGTGNGKTFFIKQALITLIRRNPPRDLEFTLIDLKRTEFSPFRKVPHVTSYIDTPDGAIDVLQKAVDTMNERYDRFVNASCYEIDQWNKLRPEKFMPRLFVWCDELSLLTQGGSRTRRQKAIKLILELVALGRAAGVNVLLCTQSVNKEVLTMPISTNINGRLCYGVRNTSASILAIGNGDAVGLRPPGRCAIVHGVETEFLQSPLVSELDIEETIARAIRGDYERGKKGHNFTWTSFDDICRFALERFGGELRMIDIWEQSGRAMQRDKIRDLIREARGNVTIDGKDYTVIPGEIKPPPVGVVPARLEPITQIEEIAITSPTTGDMTSNGTHKGESLFNE
jgi:hypothetical protein